MGRQSWTNYSINRVSILVYSGIWGQSGLESHNRPQLLLPALVTITLKLCPFLCHLIFNKNERYWRIGTQIICRRWQGENCSWSAATERPAGWVRWMESWHAPRNGNTHHLRYFQIWRCTVLFFYGFICRLGKWLEQFARWIRMVTSPSNIHRITQKMERSTRSVLKGVSPFSIGQAQVVRIRNDEITIMRSRL